MLPTLGGAGANATVTHLGTASAPITFEPYNSPYFGGDGFGFTSDSVSNIVIDGLQAAGIPVVIIASTGIGIENSDIWSDVANAIAVTHRLRLGESALYASRDTNQ